jgi:hypothetical protein
MLVQKNKKRPGFDSPLRRFQPELSLLLAPARRQDVLQGTTQLRFLYAGGRRRIKR